MNRPLAKPTKHLTRRVRKGKPRRPQKVRCPAFGWLCWDKPDHACREYAPDGWRDVDSTALALAVAMQTFPPRATL